MLGRLKRVAQEQGLPFGARTMTYNSRLAQELGKWAEDEGHGDAFHHAVFRAYFQHGENIARPQVLLDICNEIGLPVAAARSVLSQRTYRDAVDADWRRCREKGITVVPTFVIGGRRLMGAQSFAALSKMVSAAGIPRRDVSDGG